MFFAKEIPELVESRVLDIQSFSRIERLKFLVSRDKIHFVINNHEYDRDFFDS